MFAERKRKSEESGEQRENRPRMDDSGNMPAALKMSSPTASEDFSKKTDLRDFAVVVEDKQLFVNKSYLAMLSPVFHSMFYGPFKEGEEGVEEVPLPNKRYGDVLEWMQVLHPHPTTKPVTLENLELLLQLADEYQMKELQEKCANKLDDAIKDETALFKNSTTRNETLIQALRISSKYAHLWKQTKELAGKVGRMPDRAMILQLVGKVGMMPIRALILQELEGRVDPMVLVEVLKAHADMLDANLNLRKKCSECRRQCLNDCEIPPVCTRCRSSKR